MTLIILITFLLTACSSGDPAGELTNKNKPKQSGRPKVSSRADAPTARLVLEDEKIPMTWSDATDGENLLIRSDRKYYHGKNSAEVYFSVANQSGAVQQSDIYFWFEDAAKRVTAVERVKRDKARALTVSQIAGGPGNTGGIDRKESRGYTDGTRFSDKLAKNTTAYYRAIIEFPEDAQGEFFIEAFGARQGYGHLDPYYSGGLVGYWSFDGEDMDWSSTTAEVRDLSGYGNHGDAKNGPKAATGKKGQGMEFDGEDDYINVGDDISWSGDATKSVSVWFRTTQNDSTIICQATDAPADIAFWLYIDPDDHLESRMASDAYDFGGNLTDNDWHSFVFVYDGSQEKVYLDGARLGSTNTESAPATGVSNNINIGRGTHDNEYFKGKLDEVRIYDRALSKDEVADLYRAESARTEFNSADNGFMTSGLVGHWTMNGEDMDWSSTTAEVRDISGSDHHGNALNGVKAATGKKGQGLEFDGITGYIDIGNDITWSADAQKSVSVWFRTAQNDSTVICQATDAPADMAFWLYIDPDNHLESRMGGDAYDFGGNLVDNNWHSLVFVYDGSKEKVYLDGSGLGTANIESAPATGPVNNINIGRGTHDSEYFKGKIDEVRIYDRALSENEADELYRTGAAKMQVNSPANNIQTNNLVGHWTFDGQDTDWSSTTAEIQDVSGNKKFGNAKNGAKAGLGRAGQALTFDGTDDYLDLGNVYDGVKAVTFWVKTENRGGTDYFSGKLDDVRFYSRTLTARKANELYRAQSRGAMVGGASQSEPLGPARPTVRIISLNDSAEVEVVSGTVTATGFIEADIYVDGQAASIIDSQWRHVVVTTGTGVNASTARTAIKNVWACGDDLVDSRDDQSYATVQIGDQCWMAQGLNIGTRIDGSTGASDNGTIEKYCWQDNSANCDSNDNPNYPDGGLYLWDEAMGYAASCNGTGESQPECSSPVQGICPEGWHIPSHYEITQLEREVCTSGTCASDFPYDESTDGQRGTDEGDKLKPDGSSGFEFNFAGTRGTDGLWYNREYIGTFWSSTQDRPTKSWERNVKDDYTNIDRAYVQKDKGFSIRCVKD